MISRPYCAQPCVLYVLAFAVVSRKKTSLKKEDQIIVGHLCHFRFRVYVRTSSHQGANKWTLRLVFSQFPFFFLSRLKKAIVFNLCIFIFQMKKVWLVCGGWGFSSGLSRIGTTVGILIWFLINSSFLLYFISFFFLSCSVMLLLFWRSLIQLHI